MWALVENEQIVKTFNNSRGFVFNDMQYSSDIFSKWTKEEREAIGLYEVVIDNSNYKDPEYYNNSNSTIVFSNNQVTESWQTAVEKNLDEEKNKKKEIIKRQANLLLAPSDWYVIKASEVTEYSIPTDISNFRTSIRTKSDEMETAIDAVTSIDELKTLYTYTDDGNGNVTRPLGEWPEEVA
jgi:ribosome-associated translation inhibitor RaiA